MDQTLDAAFDRRRRRRETGAAAGAEPAVAAARTAGHVERAVHALERAARMGAEGRARAGLAVEVVAVARLLVLHNAVAAPGLALLRDVEDIVGGAFDQDDRALSGDEGHEDARRRRSL